MNFIKDDTMVDTMITMMYNKRVYKGEARLTFGECTCCFINKISEYKWGWS